MLIQFITKSTIVDVSNLPVIYSLRSIILRSYVGKRVLIYNGKSFVSLLIRDWHIGNCFGDFILTKKKGKIIHNLGKKK